MDSQRQGSLGSPRVPVELGTSKQVRPGQNRGYRSEETSISSELEASFLPLHRSHSHIYPMRASGLPNQGERRVLGSNAPGPGAGI